MTDGTGSERPGSDDDRHLRQELQRMMTSYEFLAAWLRARFDDEGGASVVEYALLLALIATICIAAITVLGTTTSTKVGTFGQSLAAN